MRSGGWSPRPASESSALGRANLPLVHPEVMRDLVPDGIGHEFLEMLRVPRQPLVRTLKDGDAVGHRKTLEDASLREWPALIQSEQLSAASRPRRLRLHHQRDILHPIPEPRRNFRKRALHNQIKLLWGQGFRPAAVASARRLEVQINARSHHYYNGGFGGFTGLHASAPVTLTGRRNSFPPSVTYNHFPPNASPETPPGSGGFRICATRPLASQT